MPKERRKYDMALLERLVREGKTNAEIIVIMDASEGQVSWWISRQELTGLRSKAPKRIAYREAGKAKRTRGSAKADNSDGHLCRTCEYRPAYSLRSQGAKCDYIGHTGKRRGCKAAECNVYKPKKRNREKDWSYGHEKARNQL